MLCVFQETASRKCFARMHVFSWIVWFYKAEALFHIQFIEVSGLELRDVTEDIEGICEQV